MSVKSANQSNQKKTDKAQAERFIDAARESGCSEDEAVFDENLKKIARHKSPVTPARVPPRTPRSK
jgi:hypothetical protein